jgi:hypothetical protein
MIAPTAAAWMVFLWSCALLDPAWGSTHAVQSEDHKGLVSRAQAVAEAFVDRFSARPEDDLQAIRLSYVVHMELDAFVRTTMEVTLRMEKKKDHYVSLFNLTEPQGKDAWSRFALFIYGRHTEDYRILKTRVDTTIQETFIEDPSGFRTRELKEIVPKDQGKRTGIRIVFDYQGNQVHFWEDQTRKEPERSLVYEGQTGPLAAFFNFVLFKETRSKFTVINALKRTEKVEVGEGSQSVRKKVSYLFNNERVRLQPNDTGKYTDFSNAVYFESANYLDIIYGQNIYYDIAYNETANVKLPYSVLLEGLISKSKQTEKERRLKDLMDRPMGHEALQEKLATLEQMNILAARNVRVYLTTAQMTR